jgi:hypothetical protein
MTAHQSLKKKARPLSSVSAGQPPGKRIESQLPPV